MLVTYGVSVDNHTRPVVADHNKAQTLSLSDAKLSCEAYATYVDRERVALLVYHDGVLVDDTSKWDMYCPPVV